MAERRFKCESCGRDSLHFYCKHCGDSVLVLILVLLAAATAFVVAWVVTC